MATSMIQMYAVVLLPVVKMHARVIPVVHTYARRLDNLGRLLELYHGAMDAPDQENIVFTPVYHISTTGSRPTKPNTTRTQSRRAPSLWLSHLAPLWSLPLRAALLS